MTSRSRAGGSRGDRVSGWNCGGGGCRNCEGAAGRGAGTGMEGVVRDGLAGVGGWGRIVGTEGRGFEPLAGVRESILALLMASSLAMMRRCSS